MFAVDPDTICQNYGARRPANIKENKLCALCDSAVNMNYRLCALCDSAVNIYFYN